MSGGLRYGPVVLPDWLHYLVSPWTTPFTLVAAIVGVAWLCRVRGRALAIVAASASTGVALWSAWKAGPPNGLLDLHIYTYAARTWLDGGSLYDYRDSVFNLSATYPPIGPILFAPFTPLSDEMREVLWTALSLLMLASAAWCTAVLAGWRGRRLVDLTLWGYAGAVVTIPVWITIRQGQINIVLWALVLVDLVLLTRRSRWTGLAIGIATAIKLVPGLFIVWAAAARRWPVALRATGAALAATAIGWLLDPSDSRRYWTDLLWDSGRVGALDDSRNNSLMGTIARTLPEGRVRSAIWIGAVILLLSVALVRASRASTRGDLLAVAAIIGCAAGAVSPISWSHHLGFLLVALVAFACSARTRRDVILCAVGYLVLVHPGGHGDEAWMSTVRALLCIAAVVFVPIVDGRSMPESIDEAREEPGHERPNEPVV